MVSITPLATAVVMATMIATVLTALAVGLPWYHTENTETHRVTDYYLDYAKSGGYSGFYEYGIHEMEDLQFLMWVEKVFVHIWIVLAIIFVLTCLVESKGASVLFGLCLLAVSVFVPVYFAGRIERVGDWSGETSAGLGYVLVLVAFVLQMLAILARSWHALPSVVEEFKRLGQ